MFNLYFNLFSFARKNGRPLILDGAMGSLLQSKYKTDDSLWMSYLNSEKPETVLRIHLRYIKAGADIITSNTFRTNPAAAQSLKLSKSLTAQACKIAKEAAGKESIMIAGSNPPAEDCYQNFRTLSKEKLQVNHHKHIDYLVNNEVHFILNETQSHLDEIEIICRYCSTNKIPYIISLYFTDNLKILSGEKLKEIIPFILKYAPLAIGFNCIRPETFLKFYTKNKLGFNWGVYFNCGTGSVTDENIKCGISPGEYLSFIKLILKKKPSFIGACCGSNPNHIRAIKNFFDERNLS